MNPYRKKLFILAIIAISILALISYPLLPEKVYNPLEDDRAYSFLFGITLSDGNPAANWIDESTNNFRCSYPEGGAYNTTYYCSFNVGFPFGKGSGVDLSQYKSIRLSIDYKGDAPKMRFFARNYSTKYSNPHDTNSAKYNAIFIPTKDLDNELLLSIDDFVVTEWWLLTYNISRELSKPELNNIVNLGIDFSDAMIPGHHDLKIHKIEFIGEWISREGWYLAIFSPWLFGIFITTVLQIRTIRLQTARDKLTIDQLNQSNTDLINESDKFKKLSTLDALTQSYNRFGIDQIVSTLMNSAQHLAQNKPAFSLILLDIDHFKRVNDRYGHDVGDEVLQQISVIIQKNLHSTHYFGRWGGEEFIIILPFTIENQAFELAESIRHTILASNFSDQHPMKITVSMGVGECQKNEDFSEVFKRVDDALYKAKNSGRNCSFYAEKQPVSYLGNSDHLPTR